jgi:hypothetical protein
LVLPVDSKGYRWGRRLSTSGASYASVLSFLALLR